MAPRTALWAFALVGSSPIVSELLGLRWIDVDFEKKTLRIEWALGANKEVWHPAQAAKD